MTLHRQEHALRLSLENETACSPNGCLPSVLPSMQIKQWWQAAKQSRQSLSRQLSVALQVEAAVV